MPPENKIDRHERDIVTHMNADHVRSLQEYCCHYHRRSVVAAAMMGIDCDGFDVRAGCGILRFDFQDIVTTAAQARAALATMLRQCRAP